jgi:hypothetical protein
LGGEAATALTLADFNSKLTSGERATYVTAVVSTLMFHYADQGDKQKASCLNNWYFRKTVADGEEVSPPGPTEMAREMARVGKIDPTYHVEEIVLDKIKRVCGAPPAS